MRAKTETLLAYARLAPVIPVVTIEDARHAIPLARTLVEAGLPVIEVTLRTPAALDAIAAIAKGCRRRWSAPEPS
jgi:2-dehydro-3-deoxyphosphogluconate aldolase/(4S)-4-hydroxy-2-oxoglutarate aldolase